MTGDRARLVSRPVVGTVLSGRAIGDRAKPGVAARPCTHHSTAMDYGALCREAIIKFFPKEASDESFAVFEPTQGGVNNCTQYVTVNTQPPKKYVIRVYNNACNNKLVKWEHDILRQLQSMQLSFRVPVGLPCPEDGNTFVTLSNGTNAALFELIPGHLPKLSMVTEIGKASGELVTALAKCRGSGDSPIAPIHDLWKVHHGVPSKEVFLSSIQAPAFDGVRESMDFLAAQLELMEREVEGFKLQGLPWQIMHGDLHYDNILVDDEGVTGLLDFEFLATDWRVMELAICLCKYVGEPDPLPYLKLFIDGYATTGSLTRAEMKALASSLPPWSV
eukprot:gene15612-21717_t